MQSRRGRRRQSDAEDRDDMPFYVAVSQQTQTDTLVQILASLRVSLQTYFSAVAVEFSRPEPAP